MLTQFIEEYFINPMKYGEGYNLVNTLVYSFIFIIFAVLTFEIFKRMKIKVDFKLCLAITPFILSFIVLRVLRDAEIVKGYVFMTPFIWLISFLFIISYLLLSKFLENKYGLPFHKFMFISGFILFSFLIGFLNVKNLKAFVYMLPFLIITTIILLKLKETTENKIVLGLHVFDSITTAVSLKWFGYVEQHVLPKLIISITKTPFSFIFVKFLIVYFSLKLIDKNQDREFSNFIKMLIAILGLATGGRSFLRLICGV